MNDQFVHGAAARTILTQDQKGVDHCGHPPADVDAGARRRDAQLGLRLPVRGEALVAGVHEHVADGDAVGERHAPGGDPRCKGLPVRPC